MKYLIIAAMLISSSAIAKDWYVTGGVGQARFQNGPQSGQEVTVFQAGGGLRMADWLAAEALYHQWDDVTDVSCSTTEEVIKPDYEEKLVVRKVATVTKCSGSDFRPKGYSLSAVLGKDMTVVGQGIRTFARAGIFKNDSGGFGPMAGVGVRWRNVGLEYQHINEVNTGTFESRVNSLLLTVGF